MTQANYYRFDDGSPITRQKTDEADIVLGKDVWLSIVPTGVMIGDRAIVEDGAVLMSVPVGAIVVGPPRRKVGEWALVCPRSS